MTSPLPPPTPERHSHPFLTYDMIYEIPEAIKNTLENNSRSIDSVVGKMKVREEFCYTGCGTAFFSAMLGAEILSFQNSRRHECVQALELANYHHPVNKNTTTIAVSHSGITKTTVDALRSSKKQGAFCVGITHFPDRPISQVADETLIVGNGPDQSRCHTKCYVSSAAALTKIGLEILAQINEGDSERLERIRKELAELHQMAERVLTSTDQFAKGLAEKHSMKRCFYFAGAGPNYPNALEAALKIMETSYVAAQGFETEQLLHGPWVSLDKESVLFVLSPNGPSHQRSLDLIRAATKLGSTVIPIIGQDDDEIASICGNAFRLPVVDEYLSPFLSIIPLYLFAYYMCLRRGYNPDYLRYLTPEYWGARQIVFPPGTH